MILISADSGPQVRYNIKPTHECVAKNTHCLTKQEAEVIIERELKQEISRKNRAPVSLELPRIAPGAGDQPFIHEPGGRDMSYLNRNKSPCL